jgi:hypothetical protein
LVVVEASLELYFAGGEGAKEVLRLGWCGRMENGDMLGFWRSFYRLFLWRLRLLILPWVVFAVAS